MVMATHFVRIYTLDEIKSKHKTYIPCSKYTTNVVGDGGGGKDKTRWIGEVGVESRCSESGFHEFRGNRTVG
jgi:hypothetical protein